jgi:hypothetical protein
MVTPGATLENSHRNVFSTVKDPTPPPERKGVPPTNRDHASLAVPAALKVMRSPAGPHTTLSTPRGDEGDARTTTFVEFVSWKVALCACTVNRLHTWPVLNWMGLYSDVASGEPSTVATRTRGVQSPVSRLVTVNVHATDLVAKETLTAWETRTGVRDTQGCVWARTTPLSHTQITASNLTRCWIGLKRAMGAALPCALPFPIPFTIRAPGPHATLSQIWSRL